MTQVRSTGMSAALVSGLKIYYALHLYESMFGNGSNPLFCWVALAGNSLLYDLRLRDRYTVQLEQTNIVLCANLEDLITRTICRGGKAKNFLALFSTAFLFSAVLKSAKKFSMF